MFSHRQRREDQNKVMGYPLDRWKPWAYFPTWEVMIANARYLALDWGWEVELEGGEMLTKSKEVRRVKLEKKDLPFKVQGSRDPHMPGRILVPLGREHATLPKVVGTPPETFYRYDEKKRRIECMVTMMPDGLTVAWDVCGTCAHHVRICTCPAIRPGRGVIHLYEIATGEPFEKPSYERNPTFVPKSRSTILTKEVPQRTPLVKETSKPKPLVKEHRQVEVTENTSLAEFEDDAAKTAAKRKAALLASLKPRLSKG